jgi:hypothetical protein
MAQRIIRSANKALYCSPKLSVYGEFANLTAGGSGSIVEGGMMSGLMRRA